MRQWQAAYMHEITTYPNGRHDDQVGSTAQTLDWFKQTGSDVPTTNARIFEYYRHLAERARNSPPRPIISDGQKARYPPSPVTTPARTPRRRQNVRIRRRTAVAGGADQGRAGELLR